MIKRVDRLLHQLRHGLFLSREMTSPEGWIHFLSREMPPPEGRPHFLSREMPPPEGWPHFLSREMASPEGWIHFLSREMASPEGLTHFRASEMPLPKSVGESRKIWQFPFGSRPPDHSSLRDVWRAYAIRPYTSTRQTWQASLMPPAKLRSPRLRPPWSA